MIRMLERRGAYLTTRMEGKVLKTEGSLRERAKKRELGKEGKGDEGGEGNRRSERKTQVSPRPLLYEDLNGTL